MKRVFVLFFVWMMFSLAACQPGPPPVAHDNQRAYTAEDCACLLARPNAWAPSLADVLGLDENDPRPQRQQRIAAQYLCVAHHVRDCSGAAALLTSATFAREWRQTRQDALLLALEELALGRVSDVSRRAIEKYYQQHEDEFTVPPLRTFRHAFFAPGLREDGEYYPRDRALTEATFARAAIAAGTPFVDIVPGKQTDPVGPVERSALRWEVDPVLWGLQLWEVSPVIESSSGYHLLHLIEDRPARLKPLAEVEDAVVAAVVADRLAAEQQRVMELVRKHKTLAYYPECAGGPVQATATVLQLGDTVYTRADCERWLQRLSPTEQSLYRTPERESAYIREHCERLIRLAAARELGLAHKPQVQERFTDEREALEISLLLKNCEKVSSATEPLRLPLLVDRILAKAGFRFGG